MATDERTDRISDTVQCPTRLRKPDRPYEVTSAAPSTAMKCSSGGISDDKSRMSIATFIDPFASKSVKSGVGISDRNRIKNET